MPQAKTINFKTRDGLLLCPLPQNDAELEVLSRAYFGVPLHLSSLSCWNGYGSYQVKEKYNDYHGAGFQYSQFDIDGYNHSGLFWRSVIGRLTCGGIATHSYGQVKVINHRQAKRLERWIDSRRNKESGRLLKPFVRLANQLQGLEKTR